MQILWVNIQQGARFLSLIYENFVELCEVAVLTFLEMWYDFSLNQMGLWRDRFTVGVDSFGSCVILSGKTSRWDVLRIYDMGSTMPPELLPTAALRVSIPLRFTQDDTGGPCFFDIFVCFEK